MITRAGYVDWGMRWGYALAYRRGINKVGHRQIALSC
jgi:hypothetical protein